MTQTSSCSFQMGVSVAQLPNKPQDRSVCTSSQSLSVCPYMAQNNTFLNYGDAPASLGRFREPIHNATIDTQLPAPPLHPTVPPSSHYTSCDNPTTSDPSLTDIWSQPLFPVNPHKLPTHLRNNGPTNSLQPMPGNGPAHLPPIY